MYGARTTFGKQAASKDRTAPVINFTKGKRTQVKKISLSNHIVECNHAINIKGIREFAQPYRTSRNWCEISLSRYGVLAHYI